jgi:hypothetical protein
VEREVETGTMAHPSGTHQRWEPLRTVTTPVTRRMRTMKQTIKTLALERMATPTTRG